MSKNDTYLGGQRTDCVVQTTPHDGGVTHGLGALIIAAVFVIPIKGPHKEELEQDRIGEVLGRTSPDLFGNTTRVSPKTVIPVTFGKDVVMPTIVVGPRLSWQR